MVGICSGVEAASTVTLNMGINTEENVNDYRKRSKWASEPNADE